MVLPSYRYWQVKRLHLRRYAASNFAHHFGLWSAQ
jgi:hypothetical protein